MITALDCLSYIHSRTLETEKTTMRKRRRKRRKEAVVPLGFQRTKVR